MKNNHLKKSLFRPGKALIVLLGLSLHGMHNNQAQAQCKIDYSHYKLVFEDQFNYPNLANFLSVQAAAKGAFKQPYWDHQPGNPIWSWGSEQYEANQISFPTPGFIRLQCNPVPAPYTNALGKLVTHKSGMIMLNWDLDTPVWPGFTGIAYGMFEARIRLPKGDKWPAFWLTDNNETEIDILEGTDKGASNNVHNWHIPYGSGHLQCMYDLHKKGAPLWDDFHTYTMVWTPDKITIFFDGREVRTVPSSMLPTGPNPSQLILSLQTLEWNWSATQAPDYMDIDYVRVYKPCIPLGNGCKPTELLTAADYNAQPYKSDNEWVHHTLYDPLGSLKSIHEDYGSITADRSSATNDVYYRGTDNNIYKCSRIDNDHWTNAVISESGVAKYDVRGDVVYNAARHIIVYKDKNDYIRYLYESSPGVYTGSYFIASPSRDYRVSSTPGSIQVAGDGDIVYLGKTDSRVHRLHYSGGSWSHSILGNYPSPAQLVKGDIQVGNDIYELFYKGMDNKLQGIWYNAGVFNCVYVDIYPGAGFPINDKPGSMVLKNHQILYRGPDNKMHRFYWNVSWLHQAIPHSDPWGNDLISGNICSDDNTGAVYTGNDGRMQGFYMDPSGTWYHVWIDDYFNTPDYQSYAPSATGSSNTFWDGIRIYYAGKDKTFMNFTYEPCEKIVCDPTVVVPGDYNRSAPTDSRSGIKTTTGDRMLAGRASMRPAITVNPNPGNGHITLTNARYKDYPAQVVVVNMLGVTVYNQSILFSQGKAKLDLELPPGLYVLQIKSSVEDVYQGKIIIK